MFLIDDILLFPARGILAVFREIHNAAQQEVANEEDAIRTHLSELYMLLETGRITEDEFAQGEKELLDRLDEIESGGSQTEEEHSDQDTDELSVENEPAIAE